MATLKEVQDEIVALRAFVAAEAGEAAAIIAGLTEQVTALRAQLEGQGSQPSAADLDSVLASLKEAEGAIQGIVTPPAPPSEGGKP